MSLFKRWKVLSFRRQVFLFLVAAIIAAAVVVEIVLEPLVEGNFFPIGADIDWHEVPIWIFGALALSICGAAIITRAIMRRLERLARATEEIASGNLAVRMPEGGDPEDVFNRLSHRFNSMAETIDQLLINERRLLSDISHELRSPLSRISAAVELMAMKNEGTENAAYLRRIDGELTHMNRLVGVLLEQSRNRLSVCEGRETVDVSMLAGEITDGFKMQGETQRKILTAVIAPGVQVEGHPVQVRLILENILGNAMFYTPSDTGIDMMLERDSSNARLTVRDGGPGVPEEQLAEIFKPFYRVDASRARQSGGVGLGLTLVREACTTLGGSVRAENCSPGLLVTVLLPFSGSVSTSSNSAGVGEK